MTVKPHISSINMNEHQQAKSLTVSFVNSPVTVHMRLGRKGITSYKVRGVAREMDDGDKPQQAKPFVKAALKLVYEVTGQSVWLRDKGTNKVELEYVLAKV